MCYFLHIMLLLQRISPILSPNIYRICSYRHLHKHTLTESSLRKCIDSTAREIVETRCRVQRTSSSSKRLDAAMQEIKAQAAVLVPICIVEEKTCLLFTIRSNQLNSHRGEIRIVHKKLTLPHPKYI